MKQHIRKAATKSKEDGREKSEDVNDVTADSGYETVTSKDQLGSVGGCMRAAFAVDKFRKMKILKKQEKRLGWKNNRNATKVLTLTCVLMPYSNISNVFMKKKRMKKWKPEKITLKSLKESMDAMNIKNNERKEMKANSKH